MHVEIGVFKGGIGQSVAEGERHHAVVIKVTRIAGAHDGVLIAGLIVFVADVDALLIDHVGAGIGGNFAALVPRIGDGGEVAHGGGGEVVVAVGIHQRTGGIHPSCQNFRHRIDAGNAHIADPQTGVHAVLIVLQEVHLHRVGGVDEHDETLEGAVLLQGRKLAHQFPFVIIQRQIVGGDVLRICALAAHAGDHHDGRVAVLGEGTFHFIGVDGPGGFVGGRSHGHHAGAAGAGIVLGLAGFVEVPQRLVDGAAGLFQRGFQVVGGGSVNVAGAGAAVHQIHRGGGEAADRTSGLQRQCVVFVEEQRCALLLHPLAEGQTVVDHFLGGSEITCKILGVGVFVLHRPEGAAHKGRHRVVEHIQHKVQGNADYHHQRAKDAEHLPRCDRFALGLFVGFAQFFFSGFQIFHGFLLFSIHTQLVLVDLLFCSR